MSKRFVGSKLVPYRNKPKTNNSPAPWVHPEQSKAASMKIANMLPDIILRNQNQIMSFIRSSTETVTQYSGGAMMSLFLPLEKVDPGMVNEIYEMSLEVKLELDRCQWQYSSVEASTGANDEAMICLRKGNFRSWGEADDLASCIRKIAQNSKRNTGAGSLPGGYSQVEIAPLSVTLFLPESDALTGKSGQSYFESCWYSSDFSGIIDFESVTVPGTNHDSICGPSSIIYKEIFRAVNSES